MESYRNAFAAINEEKITMRIHGVEMECRGNYSNKIQLNTHPL